MNATALAYTQREGLDAEHEARRLLALGRRHIDLIEQHGGPPPSKQQEYEAARATIERAESLFGTYDTGQLGFWPVIVAIGTWLFSLRGAVGVTAGIISIMGILNAKTVASKVGKAAGDTIDTLSDVISAMLWAGGAIVTFALIEKYYLKRSPASRGPDIGGGGERRASPPPGAGRWGRERPARPSSGGFWVGR